MAFREVTVVQIKEALRRWLRGEGERTIARGVGVDRKTARRYIAAAMELGVERSGGDEQLTDELIGQLVERVRPHRPDGHGAAWRTLLNEEQQITAWVKDDLTVTKIGILLERKGVVVPPRTLARFAVEHCGAGRRRVTVRIDDPPPGTELQVDFGRLGLLADGERRRVCHGLIFSRLQPPSVRVAHLLPDDRGGHPRLRSRLGLLRRRIPRRHPRQPEVDRDHGREHRTAIQRRLL